MNKNIKQVFHRFLTLHITVKDFEKWLYEDEEIAHIIDAMTQYYRYKGCGEYKSDDSEEDKKTYTERGWIE